MHCKNYIDKILCCPLCKGELNHQNSLILCLECKSEYTLLSSGAIDFKPIKDHTQNIQLLLPSKTKYPASDTILIKKYGERIVGRKNIPKHLSKLILSHFPYVKKGSRLLTLDLGCGDLPHKGICREYGYEYIGLDFNSKKADILADAQCLPFKDEAFDFVFSIAVLEHIQNPILLVREVERILKPDGIFIATVAFLEPFHENSYFHHSVNGIFSLFINTNLNIEFISPVEKWSGLKAILSMGYFPKMPRGLLAVILFPIEYLSKLWWFIGRLINKKAQKLNRSIMFNGSSLFKAIKHK